MRSRDVRHLSEDRILQSHVDGTMLTEEDRKHLSECAECRLAAAEIGDSLKAFTQLAERIAPKPSRKPSILPREHAAFSRTSQWRRPFLTGFATASVLVILSGIVWNQSFRTDDMAQLHEEMIQDQLLIAEIDKLEENALPTVYVEISDGQDPDLDMDGFEEDKALFHGSREGIHTAIRSQSERKRRS